MALQIIPGAQPEDVRREAGITGSTRYAVNPGAALRIDLFLDERA